MLMLRIPGHILMSEAAVVAALFNHLYIGWYNYFTALPDNKVVNRADAIR